MGLRPTIGVLALQGDFEAHGRACRAAGLGEPLEVRTTRELAAVDALILPGGESTTIAKGLERTGLFAALQERIARGLPVLGTCAGAILLSRRVEGGSVPTLAALDATAVRNAYGTQVDSFAAPLDAGAAEGLDGLRAIFIRAPRLTDLGPGVEVLARVDGHPVLVRQGRLLAATFHPELADDPRVHRLLGESVARRKREGLTPRYSASQALASEEPAAAARAMTCRA